LDHDNYNIVGVVQILNAMDWLLIVFRLYKKMPLRYRNKMIGWRTVCLGVLKIWKYHYFFMTIFES